MAEQPRPGRAGVVAVYAAAIVLGVLAGVGSLYFAFVQVLTNGSVKNGPWRTDLAIGSAGASPYLRSAIAVSAVLALDKAEVIYFLAFTDSDGDTLDTRCTYAVAGVVPAARWWSITAYARNGYLPASANGRYAVHDDTVVKTADGAFSATVGAGTSDIALTGEGRFNLMLRLYGPGPAVAADPGGVRLPAIRREGCT